MLSGITGVALGFGLCLQFVRRQIYRDHDALLEYQGRDEHPEYVVQKRADKKRRRDLKMIDPKHISDLCKISATAKPKGLGWSI
jgi:hypothetical protein